MAALVVALFALLVSVRNYRRKSDLLIRGHYGLTASASCTDKYVSSILLENLKDRSVTIFAIYLRVGWGYYILIEDFAASPLTLRAFETYRKQYQEIEFYSFNMRRVGFNSLLEDQRVKKRVVVSTLEGKYVVTTHAHHWDPTIDYFRNRTTVIATPHRTTIHGTSVGENIRFVVEVMGSSPDPEIICLRPDDYQLKIFRRFALTEESLRSRENLRAFLEEQIATGKLGCKNVIVHDAEEWRKTKNEGYDLQTFEAPKANWIQHFVLGRWFTIRSDREMQRQNERRLKDKKNT